MEAGGWPAAGLPLPLCACVGAAEGADLVPWAEVEGAAGGLAG
jgi:hypothetical protein